MLIEHHFVIIEKCWLYNELYGAISHEWCGCLAHVVLVLNTYGADSMHQISEGLRPIAVYGRVGIKCELRVLKLRSVWSFVLYEAILLDNILGSMTNYSLDSL